MRAMWCGECHLEHVSCDTWTMEKVTHGKMNSRVRGSFLSLEGNQKNWVGKGRKKRKKKKRKKKEKKEKIKIKRKRERKGKRKEKQKEKRKKRK